MVKFAVRHNFSAMKTMKRILLALLACLSFYSQIHAASPLTASKVRLLEIRKDELPKSIDANQLSLVLLMPLEACTGAASTNRQIVTKWYCGAFVGLASAPELVPYQPSLLPDSLAINPTAEMLESMGDPSKRFVLVVDWAVDVNERRSSSFFSTNLATEEVVYDRLTKKLIWHALRRDDNLTEARPDMESLNQGVQRFVVKNILTTVAGRGAQLDLATFATHWTATENVINSPPQGGSRLVVFNDYNRDKVLEHPVEFILRKVPQGGQPVSAANEEMRFLLGYQSFAAIDVAPGNYLLGWVGDKAVETITLAPGDVGYFRHKRTVLFNNSALSTMDQSEAADYLKKDFRSGVVPDTRPLQRDTSKFRFENVN